MTLIIKQSSCQLSRIPGGKKNRSPSFRKQLEQTIIIFILYNDLTTYDSAVRPFALWKFRRPPGFLPDVPAVDREGSSIKKISPQTCKNADGRQELDKNPQ
jgi:hypothetical protein